MLVKADVVCYKSNVKQLYFSKQYNAYNLLGYVLVALRSDYNVEESLLFLSTFLQLNVIKMLTVQEEPSSETQGQLVGRENVRGDD